MLALPSSLHPPALPSLPPPTWPLPLPPPCRAVLLDTPTGRIHVLESRRGLCTGLQTGMVVSAHGRWVSGSGGSSSGGSSSKAAGALAPSSFLASSIRATGGKKGPAPMVTSESLLAGR